MPVRDEIAAIRDGDGDDAEKRRAIASLKAERIHQNIPAMSRPFQRNNIRFTIQNDGFAIEEREGVMMLKITFRAQQMPNGPMLLEYDDPRNPFYFINPPIMVPDGTEPNPDYDPDRVRPIYAEWDDETDEPIGEPIEWVPDTGPMTRPKYREDLMEAMRLMLASVVVPG